MRRLDPWLLAGGALTAVLLAVALYGDRLAPFEDIVLRAQGPAGEDCPLPPGGVYPLGTDNMGRDLASLLLLGARATLVVALLAGALRLLVGIAVALVGAWLRPLGPALDAAAEMLGSFPATLAALLLVVALFAGSAPTPEAVVVTLVLVGWTGAYRLVRAELRRLAAAPFTEGARALGLSQRRVLLRHHLPHLVPLLALGAAQQVTASLVALAELGVLGVFIGGFRTANLSESMVRVRVGGNCGGFMPDLPEWAGLLAAARGLSGATAIQNLYLSRWVFLVPAAAIAFAALAVSLLGIGLARHYARRDVLRDLSASRLLGATLLATAVAAPAFLLPPRDAAALDLAADARAALPSGDVSPEAFDTLARESGLSTVRVERTATTVAQTRVPELVVRTGRGEARYLTAGWGRAGEFAPVLYAGSGGGTVRAPVAFLGLGIARADHPRAPANPFAAPVFADVAGSVPDDYAAIDVAGKAVLFVRAASYSLGRRPLQPPDLQVQIRSAVSRGAAAVLIVDPRWEVFGLSSGLANPYLQLERDEPIVEAAGVPVLVVSQPTADLLLAGSGFGMRELFPGNVLQAVALDSEPVTRSLARPLAASVEIDVRAERREHTSRSIVATKAAASGAGTLVLWAIAPSRVDGSNGAARALAAVAGLSSGSPSDVALVLFDPTGDANENARLVAAQLRGRRIHEVVGVDTLVGARLRFHTRYGILQPPFDRYADRLGLAHERSLGDTEPGWPVGLLAAFPEAPYVVVRGTGDAGDRVGDGAALLAYVVGRFGAGAPELRQ